MAVDEMTFLFAEEWFQACLPLFEILLEEARLAADGEEVNELRMESALNDIEKQCAHVTALKQSQYAKQMENVRGAIADWKEAMDSGTDGCIHTAAIFIGAARRDLFLGVRGALEGSATEVLETGVSQPSPPREEKEGT